ncbi:MAG TPA: gluconokinase [Nocardioides sp.]|nr:gluconokinase [Nocardioides sp.]
MGDHSRPRHLVVMGVSGCGKSLVAERLAVRFGLALAEGDAHHPKENVDKMAAGQPLTDEDRAPWLEALVAWTRERDAEGTSTVLSCSALKRAYRDILRDADPATFFVHLHADFDVLAERMRGRAHFMPISLLESQFDTLEPLADDELGAQVDVTPPVDTVMAVVEAAVRRHLR